MGHEHTHVRVDTSVMLIQGQTRREKKKLVIGCDFK